MAAPPDAPPGPGALRGDPPLTAPSRPPPFEVDQRRLYEVGATGTPVTHHEPPEVEARRLHRLRWLVGIGVGANAATWTLAGLVYALGGRVWGAWAGVLALATLPLLALPALLEALARLRARRRHRIRPPDFPAP